MLDSNQKSLSLIRTALDACTRIQAKHWWVLTGTPVQNKPMGKAKNAAENGEIGNRRANMTLSEFYSYATLVCCEYRGTRRVFRNDYMVKVRAP